ncbi:MAG: DUF262 domain-containing protein, partial [Geminicoccaceae bacterium]|nr:DUF262 domain-containing protein [Geminicoccaceae bacterium]
MRNEHALGRPAHFMATVVIRAHRQKKGIGSDEYQTCYIVDGQQRITTLVLLLKAIAQALDKSSNQEEADARAELEKLLVKPGNGELLLETNHQSKDYLHNYLKSGQTENRNTAKTLAGREILSAISDCQDFVENWKAFVESLKRTRSRSNTPLIDFLAFLKNRLTFVIHEIEDERTAYTTFEVLNSRGLEVSYVDRFKSSLMAAAFDTGPEVNKDLIEDLHEIWGDIYECIGLRQGMDTEALRFAATLAAKERQSRPLGEKDALKTLLNFATEPEKKPEKIRECAKWMLEVTRACDSLRKNRRLNTVTRIGQARLLAVALLLRDDLDGERKDRLFSLWERVVFRIYGLYGEDARTRVGDFVRLAWRTWNEKLA